MVRRLADPDRTPPAGSRRDDLLRIAAELFAEKGYRATTVRDIAESAGVLSGSLYHHFDSKETIVAELLESFLVDLLTRFEAIRAQRLPARETLELLVAESFSAMTRHRAAIVVYQQEGGQLAPLDRFAALAATSSRIEQIWLDVITDGAAEGSFVTDNPKLTYQFVRDALWISVRWFRADGAWTAEDLTEHFLGIVLNGLLPR